MKYLNNETDAINLFESHIKKIIFSEDGTATFIINWTESYEELKLVCSYCSNYQSCINPFNPFSENRLLLCNGFLITGFSYKKTDNGYTVQFNFDLEYEGFIRFECCDFYIEISDDHTPFQPGGNDNLIDKPLE